MNQRPVARYVIVLDRYDDDDYPGGADQVALELQEAMNQTGLPDGFFNVISRLEIDYPEKAVHTRPAPEIVPEIIEQLRQS